MKTLEVRVRSGMDDKVTITVHDAVVLQRQAEWALNITKALVAGSLITDMAAVQDPDWVANYACAIATKLLDEFEKRDWLVILPPIETRT